MAKPFCIVYMAMKGGSTPTDNDLKSLTSKIPLANSCLVCALRSTNNLSQRCYKDSSEI